MLHCLTPNADTPKRTLDELLDILREKFAVFDSDRDKGDQHINQMIEHWQRMLDGYKRWKDPPPQIIELESQIETFAVTLRSLSLQRTTAAGFCVCDQFCFLWS